MSDKQDRSTPPRAETLQVSPQLRKSVAVTCASMGTTVLASAYGLWRTRQMLDAFTGGELPFMFRALMVLVGVCAVFTVIGMTVYVFAALPVLVRGRQRAIERLLTAQGWLWTLMGVSIAGLIGVAMLSKIANLVGLL